ncbi:MAG: hypothetical protein M0Z77_03670 [Thermoplasmatales archaeon]|nr:hypothetical protein [Thermoplasmatales archaeon]
MINLKWGKFLARMLRCIGFEVHLAYLFKTAEIYGTLKNNDKEDLLRQMKMLRLNKLLEVHIRHMESHDLRSIVKKRMSMGRELL